MRIATLLMALGVSILSCIDSHAGGFFRRVPAVGEWARYEDTMFLTRFVGKPSEHTIEFTGTLLLKCVGEEVINNERHLWIEWRRHTKGVDSDGDGHWWVVKVLVPEEGLRENMLSAESVRGWRWTEDGVEPLHFTSVSSTEPYWPEVTSCLGPDSPATTARMDERTIVVNEDEVHLTYAETAPQPSRDIGNGVLSGEVTWWPDEDLAFGIASVEGTFEIDHDEDTLDIRGHATSNLVATGADAVSELPDRN